VRPSALPVANVEGFEVAMAGKLIGALLGLASFVISIGVMVFMALVPILPPQLGAVLIAVTFGPAVVLVARALVASALGY